MNKNFLKSTLAVVAVVVASLGAWKAYGAYGVNDNTLLMENLEALSQGGDNPGGGQPKELEQCLKGGSEFFTSDRIVKCPQNAWTQDEYDAYRNGSNIYTVGSEPICLTTTVGRSHTTTNVFYCYLQNK